ncbi:MAG: response regulator [Nitrospira sp.]|nr:response regulator [Nitrospira sp.]
MNDPIDPLTEQPQDFPPLVYIVDDDHDILLSLEERLRSLGFEAASYSDGFKGLKAIKSAPNELRCVLTDFSMPGLDGISLIRQARQYRPDVRFVVITAYGSIETAVEAMKQGAYDFLMKPFSPDQLGTVVKNACEKKAVREQESDSANSASAQLRDRVLSVPTHSLYPYIVGGLLHNAKNSIHSIMWQLQRSRSPGKISPIETSSDSNSLIDKLEPLAKYLTILLQVMHQITHAFYSSEEGTDAYTQVVDVANAFKQANQTLDYHFEIDKAIQELPLPVGVSTFIVGELLKNATKACADQTVTKIWLSVQAIKTDHQISFECRDTGIGFSDETMTKIRGQELRRPEGNKSGGYGLFLIQELTGRLQGSISVSRADTGGARIQVLMPYKV